MNDRSQCKGEEIDYYYKNNSVKKGFIKIKKVNKWRIYINTHKKTNNISLIVSNINILTLFNKKDCIKKYSLLLHNYLYYYSV